MVLKKAWIMHMVFNVPTISGLMQTGGYNYKTNGVFTKDSPPVKTLSTLEHQKTCD